MTPYLDDGDVRLYLGDALDVLRGMHDESVHMAVTSPPFFGLRNSDSTAATPSASTSPNPTPR